MTIGAEAPAGASPLFNWGCFSDLDPPARKNSATYPHPIHGPMDRITSVLGVINKPFLLNWAAKIERETIFKAIDYVIDEGNTHLLTTSAFRVQLGSMLGLDAKGEPKLAMNVKRDAAADTGGNAHDALERWLKNEPVPQLAAEEGHAYAAGRAWMNAVKLTPIGVEKRVYSPSLKMAGTLDLCAELSLEGQDEPVRAVIDWKTSTGHYFEQLAQIAFYGHCLREAGFPGPLWGVVVRLPKDGKAADPRYYSPEYMERYESFLVAARILYRAQKEYETEFKRF